MKINANILKLQKAASTDEYRQNLTGVFLDKEKCRAVATTGHILAIQKIPKAMADELPKSGIFKFETKGKEKDDPLSFLPAGENRFLSTSGKTTATEISETPVEFDQILRADNRKELVLHICVDRLKTLADAISEKGKTGRYISLSINPDDLERAPVFVKGNLGCGVLMPARAPEGENSPMREVCES